MNFLKINNPDINILNCCINLAKEINDLDNLKQPIFDIAEFESFNELPILYFAQDNDNIVGFIGISILVESEIEICCFVSHKYRNQKIASRLLEMVFDDYPNCTIDVSLVPGNLSGKHLLDSYNAKHESTECIMELNKVEYNCISDTVDLKPIIQNEVVSYKLMDGITTIGSAKVSNSQNTFTIFAVNINDSYQGQGYGKLLLHSLLSYQFKTKDKAILHVTKENIPAFNLYTKLGFKIAEQLEYYTL